MRDVNMPEHMTLTEDAETERRRLAAFRTALCVLASSLILPLAHHLWQAYCC